MKLNKLQEEFKKLQYLKADDWLTILAFAIAAISIMVYMDKLKNRVVAVMGQSVQSIIEEAEKVAREAQEVEV